MTLFFETEKISAGIYHCPENILNLEESVREAIVTLWLCYACKPSNVSLILDGRSRIWRLPLSYLENNLLYYAFKVLDLNDYWEYRRLLEVVAHIQPLLSGVVNYGLSSGDADVLEAANDFALYLPEGTKHLLMHCD